MDQTGTVNPAGNNTGGDAISQLKDAFNLAIEKAAATLKVSTEGQAELNALRARPN